MCGHEIGGNGLGGGSRWQDHRARSWTDRRDGTSWIVRAFWLPDELIMAQLVFDSGEESYQTWWVSRHTLRALTDLDLERLLDEARAV